MTWKDYQHLAKLLLLVSALQIVTKIVGKKKVIFYIVALIMYFCPIITISHGGGSPKEYVIIMLHNCDSLTRGVTQSRVVSLVMVLGYVCIRDN